MTTDPTRLTPASLTPRDRQRLMRRIATDLARMQRCQAGDHQMEATRSPGVFVCLWCRSVGVCPWRGLMPPAGACLTVCHGHRDLVAWQATQAGKEGHRE